MTVHKSLQIIRDEHASLGRHAAIHVNDGRKGPNEGLKLRVLSCGEAVYE
jgi:hypothetical protein